MFAKLRRQPGVPAEVRAELTLDKGERILAASPETGDPERWIVGTDRALHVPAEPFDRIPWEQIEHAEWDRDGQLLRVTRSAPFGAPMPRLELRLRDPDRLTQLIRERVTASVVVSRQVPLERGLGVRVSARRSPSGRRTDELTWSVAFDEGLDPSDPAVLDAAQDALDSVRAQVEP